MVKLLQPLIFSILGAMLVLLFQLIFLEDNQIRSVAVVDINELVGGHVVKYGRTGMSELERRELADKYRVLLEQSLDELMEDQQMVVLADQAVIRGGIDYTVRLRAVIDKKLHESKFGQQESKSK